MARIRWHGTVYSATPVRQLDNGNWRMIANTHGGRFTVGSEIEVTPDEIVEMDPAEMPQADPATGAFPSGSSGLADVEQTMAEERKTLPTVDEILKPLQQSGRERETTKLEGLD